MKEHITSNHQATRKSLNDVVGGLEDQSWVILLVQSMIYNNRG